MLVPPARPPRRLHPKLPPPPHQPTPPPSPPAVYSNVTVDQACDALTEAYVAAREREGLEPDAALTAAGFDPEDGIVLPWDETGGLRRRLLGATNDGASITDPIQVLAWTNEASKTTQVGPTACPVGSSPCPARSSQPAAATSCLARPIPRTSMRAARPAARPSLGGNAQPRVPDAYAVAPTPSGGIHPCCRLLSATLPCPRCMCCPGPSCSSARAPSCPPPAQTARCVCLHAAVCVPPCLAQLSLRQRPRTCTRIHYTAAPLRWCWHAAACAACAARPRGGLACFWHARRCQQSPPTPCTKCTSGAPLLHGMHSCRMRLGAQQPPRRLQQGRASAAQGKGSAGWAGLMALPLLSACAGCSSWQLPTSSLAVNTEPGLGQAWRALAIRSQPPGCCR